MIGWVSASGFLAGEVAHVTIKSESKIFKHKLQEGAKAHLLRWMWHYSHVKNSHQFVK